MNYHLPIYETRKELFAYLKANKGLIFAEKKAVLKKADAFGHFLSTNKMFSTKADNTSTNESILTVKSVINTTNVLDSHDDVHIDGLWSKSLKEVKQLYLLQEHDFSFKGVISGEVTATADIVNWKSLGVEALGTTQALIFESIVDKARNECMFETYKRGEVLNHSVGMRYVKLDLAINDPEEEDEYKVWQMYAGRVLNQEALLEKGYFFAVTEAKLIEGSAVLVGSNPITPTLEVKREPLTSTHKKLEVSANGEPLVSTRYETIHKITNYKFL